MLAAVVPPANAPATTKPNLLGAWTLMQVVWMGQMTDQTRTFGGPKLPEEIGVKEAIRWRPRITFEKERFILHGLNWNPHWTDRVPYKIDWSQYPAVMKSKGCTSVIWMGDDVFWWCLDDGNAGKRLDLNSMNEKRYVLVFRRGKR